VTEQALLGILDQAANGLILGVIYVLLALGLNIVLGLMGVINLAHGAFYLLGAYVAFAMSATLGFWPAVLGAALAVGLLGVLLETSLIRPLYARIPEYALLLTYGVMLVTEQLVRIAWGDEPRAMSPPEALQGSLALGPVVFPTYRVALVGLTGLLCLGVWLALTRTNFGLIVRAGMHDRLMVAALGINLPLVFAVVFGAGALLAGLAGALAGPVYGLYPSMGFTFIILAFIVVVLGGMGSFWGAVVGGLLIGEAQSLSVLGWSPAADIVGYLIMIAVLLWRPRGLFGSESVFG
jgi:branched-chain amino acid transport system permease protein